MGAMVELHEGDVLIVRRQDREPPSEADQSSMANLAQDLGLAGIVYLFPGEDVNVFHPDDDTLALLALLGLVRCSHDSATGEDQTEGPDKVWVCDTCGWRYRCVTDDAGTDHPVPA